MKKYLSALLALLMLLSLCACGSSMSKATASGDEYAMTAEAPAMAQEAYDYAAPAAPAAEPAGGLAANNSSQMAADSGDIPETDPEKIIYSANATVETTQFEQSMEALAKLIEKYGGWVQSSSINGSNYYNKSRGYDSNRSANYTIRIPSENFNTLMNSLSEIGNVPFTYVYTENVTSQYYDVQARLTAYETQETRLLEMMEKAETVSDIITIEDRLTELRYEIENLQSMLNNWDRSVNYSYVEVELDEVKEYTPETETQISYGRELWLALTGALKDAGRFFKELLVFLVSALPTIVILVALFFLLRPLYRKLRGGGGARAAKRAEKAARKAAEKAEKAARKAEQKAAEAPAEAEEKKE